MGLVKNIITKITRAMASRDPVRYARKLGVNIADDVFFSGIPDFGSEPWLVEIRSQVWLTQNVRFMCHDGSVHTIKWTDKKYNQTCKVGRIVVDEGSFIGANTMIMPNVYIGKGAVIGACSMVTKDIPDGEVWGGVPARRICTVREMAERWYAICNKDPDRDLYSGKTLREWSTDVADIYWEAKHGKYNAIIKNQRVGG